MTTTTAPNPIPFDRLLDGAKGDVRRHAAERLRARGLPDAKDEEWRHTDLRPVLDTDFATVAPAGPAPADLLFEDAPWTRIILVGNDLIVTGPPPDGLECSAADDPAAAPFNELAADDAPFALLNTALFPAVVVLRIRAGARLEHPLHVVHAAAGATPALHLPRLLVVAGAHSECRIIEHFVGGNGQPHLTAAVTEVVLAEGARVDHVRWQAEGPQARHLGALYVRQGAASVYRSHTVATGARLSRLDLHADIVGAEATCVLNGVYIGGGDQMLDTHTRIRHVAPHGQSRQLYKGILSDRARAVFKGAIYVAQAAQHTDAQQTNRALLLSPEAEAAAQPQLEIYADEVKCSHGATVGQLDDDALFYLRARGIDRGHATSILTRAFTAEALADVAVPEVADALNELVAERLEHHD